MKCFPVFLQMKPNEDGTEVEWLTLEVTLGDWWSATETINGSAVADPQLRWGAVSKIAQCDLVEQVLLGIAQTFVLKLFFLFPFPRCASRPLAVEIWPTTLPQ